MNMFSLSKRVSILLFSIGIVAVLVSLFSSARESFPFAQAAPTPCDASIHNTCQWAWNDRIGWIAHNSIDNPSVSTSYGMNIDETSGNVTGYIWNDSVGWINLAPTSGYPAAPNNGVKYDSATRQLSGWAQITGLGANGWIKFRDTGTFPYGVTLDVNGNFSGYAWSDELGYFEFAPTGYTAVKHDKNQTPSVSGWAWNDQIGWISMRFTDYDINYGVDVKDDGTIVGYAWSEIGWIQYDPTGPYPSTPNYSSKWDPITGQVSGWARAVGMPAGYGSGWIKMRSTATDTIAYGTSINRTNGQWSGYAWNDIFGWIQYAHPYGQVFTKFALSGPLPPTLTSPVNNVDTYTLYPTTALTPTMIWSAYTALDGSTQAQYEIQVDDDPDFSSTIIDDTAPSTSSQYVVNLGQLTYNVTYYWRVRVQSTNNQWSGWGTVGANGETNSFRTPKHAPPVCNYTIVPATPSTKTPTQFTDTSTTSGGASMAQWSWTFGDGQTQSGSNPTTDKNPKHTYATEGAVTTKLDGVDSDGYTCSKTIGLTVKTVLPEFHQVIPR